MSAPEQVDVNLVVDELCTEIARLNRELAVTRAHNRMLKAREGNAVVPKEAMTR